MVGVKAVQAESFKKMIKTQFREENEGSKIKIRIFKKVQKNRTQENKDKKRNLGLVTQNCSPSHAGSQA